MIRVVTCSYSIGPSALTGPHWPHWPMEHGLDDLEGLEGLGGGLNTYFLGR